MNLWRLLMCCNDSDFTFLGIPTRFAMSPDGELLLIRGSLTAEKIFMIIWRDNPYADKSSLNFLPTLLSDDVTIIGVIGRNAVFQFFMDPDGRYEGVSSWGYRIKKLWRMIRYPESLGYLWQETRPRDSIAHRRIHLCRLMDTLPSTSRIVVSGFSAGARLTADIVDCYSNIVCGIGFGYPFKHPERPLEPERFSSLASLQTPMTIFQGEFDDYGARERVTTIPMSPQVSVVFLNTNHAFQLPDSEHANILWQVSACLPPDFLR